MPTYQYACTQCGERLEAVQSFSDPALTECPECNGRLRKVFSAVGVVFKGSGFYKTDSRAPAKTGAAKSDGASGETGGGAKSDASSSGAAASSAPSGSGSGSSTGSGSGSSTGSGSGSSTGSGSGTAGAPAKKTA